MRRRPSVWETVLEARGWALSCGGPLAATTAKRRRRSDTVGGRRCKHANGVTKKGENAPQLSSTKAARSTSGEARRDPIMGARTALFPLFTSVSSILLQP